MALNMDITPLLQDDELLDAIDDIKGEIDHFVTIRIAGITIPTNITQGTYKPTGIAIMLSSANGIYLYVTSLICKCRQIGCENCRWKKSRCLNTTYQFIEMLCPQSVEIKNLLGMIPKNAPIPRSTYVYYKGMLVDNPDPLIII